jgi:xanthine permease XanP
MTQFEELKRESPFSVIGWGLALQLALPSAITLVYPALVLRSVNTPAAEIANVLSWTLFALAIATVLQSMRRGPVGCGLLLPALSSGLHLAPSLLAIKAGGLPLVAGMTLFGGLGEVVFSYLLRWLRPLFTSAITGVILFLVGMEIGLAGLHAIFDEAVNRASSPAGPIPVAVISLLATAVLVIAWERGNTLVKTFAPLAVFAAAALADGLLSQHTTRPAALPFIAIPFLPDGVYSFRFELALPFLAASLASAVRTVGGVKVLHETVHAPGPVRTDGGVRGDAAGTLLCGVFGSIGTCVALNSIPAEEAAETGNPRIAWPVAFILCVLGFSPAALGIIAGASGCVVGPLLIFYGIAMALPGLHEIQKERDCPGFLWQVGIPFLLAFATLAHAGWLQADRARLPAVVEAMLGSMLGVGLFSALMIRLAVIAASRRS